MFTPTITLPGARPGEWIIKAGKPIVLEDEISVREASKILGLSCRHILTMIDEGDFVEGKDWNRPGKKKGGKYFLNRASVWARKTARESDL